MSKLVDMTFPQTKEEFKEAIDFIDLLWPHGNLTLTSKDKNISLRIGSKLNPSFFQSRNNGYVDITKDFGPDMSFIIDLWKEAASPERLRDNELHVQGRRKGWQYMKIQPFGSGTIAYEALILPLKNFRRGSYLYIYDEGMGIFPE